MEITTLLDVHSREELYRWYKENHKAGPQRFTFQFLMILLVLTPQFLGKEVFRIGQKLAISAGCSPTASGGSSGPRMPMMMA